MKKKINKYDFLIIGGGLIGSIAALALQQKNLKVLVLEKIKKISDDRTLAVNSNSKNFLASLGLWDNFNKKPENIDKIIIKDYVNHEPLVFENHKPMGYVAYNQEILKKARTKLLKSHSLIYNFDFCLNDILGEKKLIYKNKLYQFKNIILSIGKNFNLPYAIHKKNFHSEHKSYVGFFNHSKNHQNIAYEIFTKEGPLAVLPAPKHDKKKSTFIFSTKNKISKQKLKSLLSSNFNSSHGSINLLPSISNFDLAPHLSKTVNDNYILIGDTMRSIHPVAGQGWNLGIKDIQTLCSLLNTLQVDNPKLNSLYHSRRIIESTAYLTFTSLINALYDNENFFSHNVIKFGYQSLLNIGALRASFVKQAMGESSLIG